ncbi:LAME_0A04038g1_1 [Lachancea meyersii CBS 8951]|uniref:ADP-ribose 1''-phosphate phosphatase n=1 Tax=Lachancea meyersii CBS 8951 TaxID=1266667 RepID=A0A1G4INU5_9SACH|nr:LAME_0A04038g1_1 [Lachancea meyersii CBS 8951]
MSASNVKYLRGNCLAGTISHPRILIHSCNCNGSWGGGIAYQLGVKYPKAEKDYIEICEKFGSRLLGKFVLIPSYSDSTLLIGCLFTASFGGPNQGSGKTILENTQLALEDMRVKLKGGKLNPGSDVDGFTSQMMEKVKAKLRYRLDEYALEMPQINSGIFGVPWPQTEKLLKEQHSLSFAVYVL